MKLSRRGLQGPERGGVPFDADGTQGQGAAAARRRRAVLCPVKVGDDKIDAVYVTDDPNADHDRLRGAAHLELNNIGEEVAKDFNLVSYRIPVMRKQRTRSWSPG